MIRRSQALAAVLAVTSITGVSPANFDCQNELFTLSECMVTGGQNTLVGCQDCLYEQVPEANLTNGDTCESLNAEVCPLLAVTCNRTCALSTCQQETNEWATCVSFANKFGNCSINCQPITEENGGGGTTDGTGSTSGSGTATMGSLVALGLLLASIV